MIALSSAMLTCLDLSTACATWCWCCMDTQIQNATSHVDHETSYSQIKIESKHAKPATRQHLSLWKTTNKADVHEPQTEKSCCLCGRFEVPRGRYDYKTAKSTQRGLEKYSVKYWSRKEVGNGKLSVDDHLCCK